MATVLIEEVDQAVIAFLKDVLHADEGCIRILQTARIRGGWSVDAGVLEKNRFLESLGLPMSLREVNVYSITLNNDLEVLCYVQVAKEDAL
ncbi:MAG: hypothetical protein M0Z52_12810 [Actinomycetota bacterium]|nr:hypothetical protein [Actinomycetota bacterium]